MTWRELATERLAGRSSRAVAAMVGGFVAFTVLGFLLSLVNGPFDTLKVGSLGEWAAAVGTVAALSVALWEVSETQRRQREMEDRSEEQAIEALAAARRAQAEHVAVWCLDQTCGPVFDPKRHTRPDEAIFDSDAWRQEVTVALVNTSEQPVYGVEVHNAWWIDVDKLGRGARTMVIHGPQALGPRERIEFPFNRMPDGENELWPALELRFVDAAGVAWRRNANGQLSEDSRPRSHRTSGPWSGGDQRAEYRVNNGLPPLDDSAG